MNKAKPSNTIFDRMVNQLTTAAHQAAHNSKESSTEPTPASSGESSRLDRLMKLSGLSNMQKDKIGQAGPESMFQEGDGALDLGVAEKMLKWHAEAVGRMVELSAAGDVYVALPSFVLDAETDQLAVCRPKNAFSLLKVLADSFGKAYVETALDTCVHLSPPSFPTTDVPFTLSALHQLSLYDSKSEPDLGPIYIIRLVDMIMHLWQRYISTALVPLAGTSVTVRREMSIFNNHVVVRIEGKVNAIVQRTTDGAFSLRDPRAIPDFLREQPSYPGSRSSSPSRRRWISSPRTTTWRSRGSTPSHACSRATSSSRCAKRL